MGKLQSREDIHVTISNLAGLTPEGHVLPPPEGAQIDRTPSPYWKNRTESMTDRFQVKEAFAKQVRDAMSALGFIGGDAELPLNQDAAVVGPFTRQDEFDAAVAGGREYGAVVVSASGRELMLNSEPSRMAALVEARTDAAVRVWNVNCPDFKVG